MHQTFDQVVRDNINDLKKNKHTTCLLYAHVVEVQKHFKEPLVIKKTKDEFYSVSIPKKKGVR